jgi:outer membrane immunogenic protein
MKMKIIVAIAALLAAPASSALAQVLLPPVDTGSNSASAGSWLAGAQAGYNWQRNSVVYGLEADISAMHLKSGVTSALQGPLVPAPMGSVNADIDWYGTVRGRLGWAQGPLLFYGTGGLAYGHVDLNGSVPDAPNPLSAQTSSVRAGWVAGGGIGYMWRPNVILNLEYQYVDLGTLSLASSSTAAGATTTINAAAHAQFQIVAVGLSWLFSPGGQAPHGAWDGAYGGGHAGGAWGNDTNASYSASPFIISDRRLKRDVTLVGRLDDGLGLYRYRYLWSDTVHVGVMAQEVALLHPDAVVRGVLDDYLRVDYGRLGLKLMSLPDWDARGKGERL